MKSIYMDIVKYNMLLTSELIKIMKLLEENDIKAIAFKGPTLAQLAYGDITLRQYVDLDILVDEKDLYNSAMILKSINLEADLSLEFLKNVTLIKVGSDFSLFHKYNNIHLELHWNLFRKLLNEKRKDFISSNQLSININGKDINTLDYNYLLIYLCVHGSKHLWERIEWIIDLDKLINKGTFDWNFMINTSRELKVYNMFLLGICLTDELFDTNIPLSIKELYVSNQKVNKLKTKILDLIDSKIMHQVEENKYMTLKFKIIMQMFDTKRESIKYILSVIFKPTHYDVYFINIYKSFSFLYYLVRPIRLIYSYFKK
jgi:hypothetical protein